jgi:hypothetical protein
MFLAIQSNVTLFPISRLGEVLYAIGDKWEGKVWMAPHLRRDL